MKGTLALLVCEVESAGYGSPEPEHAFHPDRKWRFDLAWPAYRVAFEREGMPKRGGGKSRHTTPEGYVGDIEKYNAAQILGWVVIRGTGHMIEDGRAVRDLLAALSGRATTTPEGNPE